MRSLVRTISALALVALLSLIPASAASAAKKPKPAAFAAKYHLKGSWKSKDADKDGLKNLKEFKLGTNPKKADSDKDGLKDGDEVTSANNPLKADTDKDGTKDGAEHAGVVTAFDGETVTIREFNGGKKVTAALETDCESDFDEDASADDSTVDDDTYVPVDDGADEWLPEDGLTAESSSVDDDGEEEEIDLGDGAGDDDDIDADTSSCDAEELEKGTVLSSAELERTDGVLYLVSFKLA